MKVLVLYEELAWYFVNCLNTLCENYPCEVFVINKKSSSDAPFQFNSVHSAVKIQDRACLSNDEMLRRARDFKPDIVFLAGWSFKPYINIVRSIPSTCTIIGFDNQWTGSLRQRLGSLFFKLRIKPTIKYAFVPGNRQSQFASRLGFKKSEIITGAYCCDFNLFNGYYHSTKELKQSKFPKRFLFAGRYVEEKGIEILWDAFIELQTEEPSDWELWCLGKGSIEPVKHEKIRHLGFKQPEEMLEIVKNTGIFVLPSTFEPWGVVVHEFAAAGFPLICSDKVGAADVFVKENENGFIIRAGEKKDLKDKLKRIMMMPDEELIQLSKKSNELASLIRPELWASNLMNACK